MAEIFRWIEENRIRDYDLSLETADEIIPELLKTAKNGFRLLRKDGSWKFQSEKAVLANGSVFTEKVIELGDIYIVDREDKQAAMVLPRIKGNGLSLEWEGTAITVGRSKDNVIVMDCPVISAHHCCIYQQDGVWKISDMKSRNGTYVNDKIVRECTLVSGDEIKIGPYVLHVEEVLTICHTDEKLNIKGNKKSSHLVARPYPWFSRSPRLKAEIPVTHVNIEAAPDIGEKPTMGIGGISFSIPTMAVSMGMQGARYMIGKKKYKKQQEQRENVYQNYLSDIEEKLSFHNQRQKEVLEKKYPNCMECMARVEGPSAALWERHPQENDFMNLRLGTGEVPSSATVTVPHSSLSLKEDEYDKTPQELAEKYHMVSDAPIVSEFLKYGNCGLVGKREDTIAMARSMIIQVASLHSYEEVKIIGLYPESEQEMWDWMRWLPHCTDDGHNVRFVASNVSESAPVLDVWKKVLDRRKEQKENLMYQQKVLPLPYLLFVVADSKLIMDTPIGNYLQMNQPALGMGAIILSESVSEFPHSVQNIVELYGTIGRIYQRERSNEKVSFIPEYAPQELKVLDTYARKMAPIRLRGGKGDQGLPSMLTFLDGLHIKNVEQLEIGDYWLNCSPERSLAVPIGVRSNGKPFYFNIHEKGHGPHGIVAGKTGSGKTEMVQTWITSMALQFSPEDVNFVLVDFKGTGLLEPFQNLPHLAGMISNLDKDITRNLTSLNSEMARRMTILKNTSSKDILQYRERCKVHPKWEKLPFLILIFDEFADFKQQFPEFMGTIDSILREGRSIGVYAVLMAQNPSGITTEQTNANIGFRWCLKVASDAASREIIGKTDAASILNPGRAYVKSSTPEGEVYELIQSYYAGAEYNPDKEEENITRVAVSAVERNGRRKTGNLPKVEKGTKKHEIDVVIEEIVDYCRKNRVKKARQIWLPKLSGQILLPDIQKDDLYEIQSLTEGPKAVIGQMDNPAKQSQEILQHEFWEKGNFGVYGITMTGKTTFLQTVMVSLCTRYQPDEVQIYLMEFGGYGLRNLEIFPHVGGAAGDDEPEVLKKITKQLKEEIGVRKAIFRKAGAGSMAAYAEAVGTKLPTIIWLVDNMSQANNCFPELMSEWIMIAREGPARGIFLGASFFGVNGIPINLSQSIKVNFALQLADKMDYYSLVGRTSGKGPEPYLGRGLVSGEKGPLEFQTALPGRQISDGLRTKELREMAKAMQENWNGSGPKRIRIMPDQIAYGSLKGTGWILGADYEDVETVSLDSMETMGLLVSHRDGNEWSDLVKCILRQYREERPEDACPLYFFSPNLSRWNDVLNDDDMLYEDGGELDGDIEAIADILRARQRDLQNGADSKGFPVLLLMIDGLKRLIESAHPDTPKRIETFVNLGRGLNVLVIAADTSENLANCYYKGDVLTDTLKKQCPTLLMEGTLAEHSLFDTISLRMSYPKQMEAYEAFYLNENEKLHIKRMSGDES